jgi:hypothetical protein
MPVVLWFAVFALISCVNDDSVLSAYEPDSFALCSQHCVTPGISNTF